MAGLYHNPEQLETLRTLRTIQGIRRLVEEIMIDEADFSLFCEAEFESLAEAADFGLFALDCSENYSGSLTSADPPALTSTAKKRRIDKDIDLNLKQRRSAVDSRADSGATKLSDTREDGVRGRETNAAVAISSSGSIRKSKVSQMIEHVLKYPHMIFNTFNRGQFSSLKVIYDRILNPSCDCRTFVRGEPAKLIPRDQLIVFSEALVEAMPDIFWSIEDTKFVKGKPKRIESAFVLTGTPINNSARDFINSFCPGGINTDAAEAVGRSDQETRRVGTGAIILELNDALKVSSFEIWHSNPIPGLHVTGSKAGGSDGEHGKNA